MRQRTQKIIFITIYTLLFSWLIFVWTELIFPSHIHEEKYVEPELTSHFYDLDDPDTDPFQWVSQQELDATMKKLIYENYSKKYSESEQSKVQLRFIPTSLWEDIAFSYMPIAELFLFHRNILSQIRDTTLLLYKNSSHTRGRMKDGNIHMYNPESMTDAEFLAVLIHEFGHYYDIHSLKGNTFGDVSQKFYDISWQSVTTVKPWFSRDDFVSGYSMTNQYEDFAETYLYYILHNEEFAFKSLSNETLEKKYDFMRWYVKLWSGLTLSSFGIHEMQDYYWDITKLPVDVKKFLQYLQEGI